MSLFHLLFPITSPQRPQVHIKGHAISCPTGTTVNLAAALPSLFYSGSVACPDNARVCRSLGCSDSCGAHGTCRDGRCFCNLENTGERRSCNRLAIAVGAGHCPCILTLGVGVISRSGK